MNPIETHTGVDGTRLLYLSDADFNAKVEDFLRDTPKEEWPRYLQDGPQKIFQLTGLGYYPNGMAHNGVIYLRWKWRGDRELLAHEYGHILGLDHVPGPSIMNAVSQMRFTDPHNLEQKAQENFPEPWRKHIHPREAYRRMATGSLALMAAWAWMT